MEVTEGSANSKAVVSVTRLGSPGGKRQIRGGQSLMGKRGGKKRCRLLGSQGVQRSRTPGCDAIRLAGAMHALILLIT